MNKKTICFERVPATQIIAYLNDFDNGEREENKVAAWKNAFYELWRWQMGWGFAHKIELTESRALGVLVVLLVKNQYKDSVISMMENLGYNNIKTFDETIASVDIYDFGDDIDIVIGE